MRAIVGFTNNLIERLFAAGNVEVQRIAIGVHTV